MRTFNIEEARAGKPVITRDGRSAKILSIYKDDNGNDQIVAMTYVLGQDTKFPYICSSDGVSLERYKHLDLFMKREETIYHYAVYLTSNMKIKTTKMYKSKKELMSETKDLAVVETRTIVIKKQEKEIK